MNLLDRPFTRVMVPFTDGTAAEAWARARLGAQFRDRSTDKRRIWMARLGQDWQGRAASHEAAERGVVRFYFRDAEFATEFAQVWGVK